MFSTLGGIRLAGNLIVVLSRDLTCFQQARNYIFQNKFLTWGFALLANQKLDLQQQPFRLKGRG